MAPARLDHVGGKGEGAAEDATRDPGDRSDSRQGRPGRCRATCRRVAGASTFLLLRRCGPSGVGRHRDLIDRRAELPHTISAGILRAGRDRLRFARARFVDHPLEQATHRDAEARRLFLDPGAPLVVEPDAYNGGLCRRHDQLTVTRGVYVGGRRMVATRWWLVQARRGRGRGPLFAARGPWSAQNPSPPRAPRPRDHRGGRDATLRRGPGRGRAAAPRERRDDEATAPVAGKRVWLRPPRRVGAQPGTAACAATSWTGVNGVTQDVYIRRRTGDGPKVFRSLTGIGL